MADRPEILQNFIIDLYVSSCESCFICIAFYKSVLMTLLDKNHFYHSISISRVQMKTLQLHDGSDHGMVMTKD